MIEETTTACTTKVSPSQPSPGTNTLLGLHSPSSPSPSLCPPCTIGAPPHPTQGPGSVSSLHLKVFIPRGEKEERTVLVGQEGALWTAQHLMVGQGLPWVTKREHVGFRVLWSPPSWLPDLNRVGLLQALRASVLLPQEGIAGPHAQHLISTQLPMPQLQLLGS